MKKLAFLLFLLVPACDGDDASSSDPEVVVDASVDAPVDASRSDSEVVADASVDAAADSSISDSGVPGDAGDASTDAD